MADFVRVLMLGPHPRGGGGMGTVVEQLLACNLASTGIDLRFVASHHGQSQVRKIVYFIHALWTLTICSLLRRIDLVHVHTCSGKSFLRAAAFILMARCFGQPVLLHIHGGGFPEYVKRFQAVKMRLIGCCALVLVVNDHLCAMFEDQPFRSRVKVLYNMLPEPPVAGARHCPTDKGDGVANILFLGRFEAAKGCIELLDAFRMLHGAHPRARLIMAGNGPLWDAARRFVEEHRLDGSVELPGWVEGQAKQRLLAEADILVLPSRCEAFPMTVLEAMQWAIPVVTVARPGAETQVVHGHTGLIARSISPADIHGALCELLQNPPLRRDYGAAGRRRFLERFTSEAIMRQLVDLYRSAAAGKRLPVIAEVHHG
jgi:glycosyltransferase involved in cell wall biosynthesis